MLLFDSFKVYLKPIGVGLVLFGLSGTPEAVIAQPADDGIIPIGEAVDDWNEGLMASSGSAVRAVRVVTDQPMLTGLATAWVPASLEGEEICLNVQGDNGSYQGTQRLRVAGGWTGGAATVPLVTKFTSPPRDVAALSADAAYARLEVGSCKDFREDLVLLAATWKRVVASSPVELELLITVPETQRIAIRVNGTTNRCDRVPFNASGVNVICPITVANPTSDIGFEVRRSRLKETTSGSIERDELQSIFGKVRLR